MDSSSLQKLIPGVVKESLRYRLLALLLLSLLVLMSLTMLVTQQTAKHELGEVLDGQMITTGRAVFSVVATELQKGETSTIAELLDAFVRLRQGRGDWEGKGNSFGSYDQEFYFQLVSPAGSTVFASRQPPLLQSPVGKTGLFNARADDGNQWHLFGLQDRETGYTFYTGQSQTLRNDLSWESVSHILLPFALMSLLILGAVWFGTGYGLKPLLQMTRELDSRTPDALETIEVGDKATELRPLVHAMNQLFTRVRTSLATERQFSADASHELRTPLAGIKANLDAVRILSESPEQVKFLDNIESCVDNATQVTEGLLLLSRLQSTDLEAYFNRNEFDVTATILAEIKSRTALHPCWKTRIVLPSSADSERLLFNGPENLVAIAFGNILDNALKYSDGPVRIETQKDSGHTIVVTVMDEGPGIPEKAQDLAFQRFHRINTESKSGFGLGLAMVRQIMKALKGDVQMTNRLPTGLAVSLILPAIQLSGEVKANNAG